MMCFLRIFYKFFWKIQQNMFQPSGSLHAIYLEIFWSIWSFYTRWSLWKRPWVISCCFEESLVILVKDRVDGCLNFFWYSYISVIIEYDVQNDGCCVYFVQECFWNDSSSSGLTLCYVRLKYLLTVFCRDSLEPNYIVFADQWCFQVAVWSGGDLWSRVVVMLVVFDE